MSGPRSICFFVGLLCGMASGQVQAQISEGSIDGQKVESTTDQPAIGNPQGLSSTGNQQTAFSESVNIQTNETVLVELVLEISSTPMTGDPVRIPSRSTPPKSFMLKEDESHSVLFPLLGKAIPENIPQLYVAITIVDHTGMDPVVRRELFYDENGQVTVDLTDPRDSLPMPTSFTWPGAVEILLGDDDSVSVGFGNKMIQLENRKFVEVNRFAEPFKVDRLIERQAQTLKQSGKPVPDLEVLRRKLLASLEVQEPIPQTFFQRLLVRSVGEVELADFDTEHIWQQALHASEFGPYLEAEAMLESVLEVFPEHQPARDLLLQVADRIDRGVQPFRVSGKLNYPLSVSMEELQTLWNDFHAGIVVLKPVSGNTVSELGDEEFASAVVDGRFELGVPEGRYRLEVNVPGCALHEQEIDVTQTVEIKVELEP